MFIKKGQPNQEFFLLTVLLTSCHLVSLQMREANSLECVHLDSNQPQITS